MDTSIKVVTYGIPEEVRADLESDVRQIFSAVAGAGKSKTDFPLLIQYLAGHPIVALCMQVYASSPDMSIEQALTLMVIQMHNHSSQGDAIINKNFELDAVLDKLSAQ